MPMVQLPCIPSFKTCLRFPVNMRITDPRWPAVREAARRLLREDNLTVCGPSWIKERVHHLAVTMGDCLPSKVTFPEFKLNEGGAVVFCESTGMQTVVHCGLDEPHTDVVWIPLNVHEAWSCVEATALDLLDAGYPGCVGCAGAEAEQPWDEAASRKRIKTDEINE